MYRRFRTGRGLCASVLATGLWFLTAAPGQAQGPVYASPAACPPASMGSGASGAAPSTPQMPSLSESANMPSTGDMAAAAGAPESAAGFGASTGSQVSMTGYIDSAIPLTQIRLRYDAAFDANRPDRAEFLYAKCGCFRLQGAPPDPKAAGPLVKPLEVDYQNLSTYLEYAIDNRFSGFVELPVRFMHFEDRIDRFNFNSSQSGFADMDAGVKYALIANDCQYLTAQFTTYAPTGDSYKGLGTNHVSLEPALLHYLALSDRARIESELKDWIPVGGSDFAGNVLIYGIGASYDVYTRPSFRVSPVLEFVGWTVLSGKELVLDANKGPVSAAGDTIVNAKIGTRVFFGEGSTAGIPGRTDIYLGYGRALTGDRWYRDIARAELRIRF